MVIPGLFFAYYTYKKNTEGVTLIDLPTLSTQSLPDFTLATQTGDSLSRSELKDKIVIANFFFTTCPGICPKMSTQMRRMQNWIASHPNLTSDYMLISHSVDPIVDSVKALSNYADLYDVDPALWKLLTGKQKEIYTLAFDFYKLSVLEAEEDIEEAFVHSEKLVLMDRDGYIRGYYNGIDSSSITSLQRDVVYLDLSYSVADGKKAKKEKRERNEE